MQALDYFDRWFLAGKKGIKPLQERAARKRHEAKHPYTVAIGGLPRPSFVVSVGAPWVNVSFMDASVRDYLVYEFKTVEGRLFLSTIDYRTYASDGIDDPNVVLRVDFELDGSALMRELTVATDQVVEKRSNFDTSLHWEERPTFGDYSSLCQKEKSERALAPLLQWPRP